LNIVYPVMAHEPPAWNENSTSLEDVMTEDDANELLRVQTEMKRMIPYCQCAYHVSKVPFFLRWPNVTVLCPCCVGCLRQGQSFANIDVYVKTLHYYNDLQESSWLRFWHFVNISKYT